MPTPSSPGDVLAGYRLLRKLGTGERATVYLAVPGDEDRGDPAVRDGVAAAGQSFAVKVFRPAVSLESIGGEIEALCRSSSPHCVRLVDLASGADGRPVIVLSRASQGSLATLLRKRNSLELGEAITILAPVVAAVSALHAAGVAHGAISATTVHFGRAGEPVLLGFGHASLFEQGAPVVVDSVPAAIHDRQRLLLLGELVLTSVREGERSQELFALRQWMAGATIGADFGAELEERLFDLAAAQPILFGRAEEAEAVRSPLPGRLLAPSGTAEVMRTTASGSGPARRRASQGEPKLRDGLLGTEPLAVLRRSLGDLWRSMRAVRRPLWVLAAVVALGLGAALVLIPRDVDPPAADVTPTGNRSAAATQPAIAPEADPLTALMLLLDERQRCFRDLSLLCLEAVDHPGSSLLVDDRAIIDAIRAGAEVPGAGASIDVDAAAARDARLVQRLGDSALIGLRAKNDPASVLMIETEAGWRLREFLPG